MYMKGTKGGKRAKEGKGAKKAKGPRRSRGPRGAREPRQRIQETCYKSREMLRMKIWGKFAKVEEKK